MSPLCILALAAAATLPFDYSGDGRVSRAEYDNAIARLAERLDVNRDGIIDTGEFAWTPAAIALFDNDRNGTVAAVDLDEFRSGFASAFEAMDVDGDGYLQPDELIPGAALYGLPLE